MFKLDYPVLIFIFILTGLLYRFWAKVTFYKSIPELRYSSLSSFLQRKKTFLELFSKVPEWIFIVGLGSLAIALADPHRLIDEPSADLPPREGLAFYLLLDRSGSMGKVIDQTGKRGALEVVTRFDRLQEAATKVIQTSPQDLIGIITFARAAEIISPLTLDHQLLEKRIKKLTLIKDVNQDGTSIGYAIYKTANLIAASKAFNDEDSPYKILSAFMIIITDGLQDPSKLDKGNRLRSMDLEEAAIFAKSKGIKVFIVNIEARVNDAQFAPNRREMERITALTGGKLIVADHLEQLEKIIESIPKGERSTITADGKPFMASRFSFFPYFVGLGLILLALSVGLQQTFWRRAI